MKMNCKLQCYEIKNGHNLQSGIFWECHLNVELCIVFIDAFVGTASFVQKEKSSIQKGVGTPHMSWTGLNLNAFNNQLNANTNINQF